MKLVHKIAMGALGVIVITNPASGQVILDGLDVIFKLIFQFGSPANFVASIVLGGCLVYIIWESRDEANIPKKSAKTLKAGRLIET